MDLSKICSRNSRIYIHTSSLTIYFRFGSYVSTTTPEPNVCD